MFANLYGFYHREYVRIREHELRQRSNQYCLAGKKNYYEINSITGTCVIRCNGICRRL
ncbi:hypothetical protein ALTERO38_60014 [Alteromonas sp. 38]|nr:hypothetical protein ALTER154_40777 [Alteromonas sp. 154]VXC05250.1 hypothetical protein ALTERO38_60014 [Alteromonas sp. 38]